jgi:hypothetical protein
MLSRFIDYITLNLMLPPAAYHTTLQKHLSTDMEQQTEDLRPMVGAKQLNNAEYEH